MQATLREKTLLEIGAKKRKPVQPGSSGGQVGLDEASVAGSSARGCLPAPMQATGPAPVRVEPEPPPEKEEPLEEQGGCQKSKTRPAKEAPARPGPAESRGVQLGSGKTSGSKVGAALCLGAVCVSGALSVSLP